MRFWFQEAPVWQEAFGAPPPGRLHHYTSIAGLHGMVESKSVWATNIACMNDREEFVHATRLTAEVCARVRKVASAKRQGYLSAVEAEMITQLRSLPPWYVASFCVEPDSLTLWRGYTEPDAGYCLAIDWRHDSGRELVIMPCVYDDDLKVALVEELLQSFELATREQLESWLSATVGGASADASEGDLRVLAFFSAALNLAPAFKHASFRDEREWRVVRISSEPRYRPGRTGIMPYVPIDLGGKGHARIVEAWVGPMPDQEIARMALEQFLVSSRDADGPEAIVVKASGVPYVQR